MTPRLTILLPLKGRPLHTLRFLYHADSTRLPYRLIIADGETREPLSSMLRNSREHFPNLDIEYVEYPDDSSFSQFYQKMADATARVKTPFAMQIDNDDFVLPSGLERAMDFLEENPDFCCYCSSTAVFSIYSRTRSPERGVRGRLNMIYYGSKGSFHAKYLSSSDVAERIRHGGRCTGGLIYYGVFRSKTLADVCSEVADLDFSDLQIHEIYFTLRALVAGKAQAEDGVLTYLRQIGTSMRSAFKNTWLNHILRSRFTCDVKSSIGQLSELSARQGADRSIVVNDIYAIFETRIGHLLRNAYGPMHRIRQSVKVFMPGLVKRYKNRPPFFVGWQRTRMLRKMASAGASPVAQERLRFELSGIEQTLSGREFSAFLRSHLSAFVSSSQS